MKALFVLSILFLSFFSMQAQSLPFKEEEHKLIIVNKSSSMIVGVFSGLQKDEQLTNLIKSPLKPETVSILVTRYLTNYRFGFVMVTMGNTEGRCIIDDVLMDKNYVVFLSNLGCELVTEKEVLKDLRQLDKKLVGATVEKDSYGKTQIRQ
jgi:hypothetical protein